MAKTLHHFSWQRHALTAAVLALAQSGFSVASISGSYGIGTVSVIFSPTTAGCSPSSFQQSLAIMESGQIVRVADTIPTEVTIFEEWRKQS